MAEGDKFSTGELKRRTIGTLEELGYKVTEQARIVIEDQSREKYGGGFVFDDGKIRVEYSGTPNEILAQISLRDKARGKGLEVMEYNRDETRSFFNDEVSQSQKVLDVI